MLERAVIRVWSQQPQQFLGSAFLIAPGYAVTAKHVVANSAYSFLYLAGPPWGGQRTLAQAPRLHPQRDIALLELAKADAQDYLSLAAAPVTLQPGQTVMVAGYSTVEQDLELLSLEISGYDGQTDALVLHTFIGRGISGGPVLLENQLVGLLYARDTDRNRSYIIPLEVFRDFIQPLAARVAQPKPNRDEQHLRNQLIEVLRTYFNAEGLKLLYLMLFGEAAEQNSKALLIIELIEKAKNHQRLSELEQLIKKERPNVDFE